MRIGKLRLWAGLVGLSLLTSGFGRADEPIAPPRAPVGSLPASLPNEVHNPAPPSTPVAPHVVDGHGAGHNGHNGQAEHGHEIETGPLSGFFLEGEYLLIRARRQRLDYAIITPNAAVLPSGTVNSVYWGTRSGFRAGGGYRMEDGWAIGAFVTNFHAEDDRFAQAPPGGALLATLTQGGGIESVATARPVTNIDFTVIDLEASKQLCIGDSLALKLFGGGRLAFIDQNLSCIYEGGNLGLNNPLFVNSPIYFRGAGLTGGAEGLWKVWHNWGLYGRTRLSLISGQFTQELTESLNSMGVIITNVNEKYKAVVPVVEMGAGIGYQGEHFSLKIGYDLANWFNMVDSIDFPDGTSFGHIGRRQSDLMLEMLTVQLGVTF
jgi:hypothetical protein